MKRFIFSILILLIAFPCFGAQTVHKRLEPETVVYNALPNAAQTQFTTNQNVVAVKYKTGVVISGLTVGISNATGYLFLTNPSVDLRWMKGFYLNLNDGASKNLKVLIGNTGTTETQSSEKITNGNFANWTGELPNELPNNWSRIGTADANNYITQSPAGQCTIVRAAGVTYPEQALTSGGLYYLSFDLNAVSLSMSVAQPVGTIVTYTTTGTKTLRFTGNGGLIRFFPALNSTCQVDNFSILQYLTPSALGAYFSSPTVDLGFNYGATSFTATATRN